MSNKLYQLSDNTGDFKHVGFQHVELVVDICIALFNTILD